MKSPIELLRELLAIEPDDEGALMIPSIVPEGADPDDYSVHERKFMDEVRECVANWTKPGLYLVLSTRDYEGSTVVAAFEDQEHATALRDKLEEFKLLRGSEKYSVELWLDGATEGIEIR
jgi:hypothetical protein